MRQERETSVIRLRFRNVGHSRLGGFVGLDSTRVITGSAKIMRPQAITNTKSRRVVGPALAPIPYSTAQVRRSTATAPRKKYIPVISPPRGLSGSERTGMCLQAAQVSTFTK